MRILMMILVVMSFATPAFAQAYDSDAMAARMNRDGDYPWDPSNRQYIKFPPRHEIIRYQRDMARYEIYRQNKAQADWKAMTPDEKRRFIRRHPEAFAPGGIYYDTY